MPTPMEPPHQPTIDELAEEVWQDESPAIAPSGEEDGSWHELIGHVPPLLDLPIGLAGIGWRAESDSLGAVRVPADRYWGAQTQRSLTHFSIGAERMPLAIYRAYGHVKKAAAVANARAGVLPAWKAAAISRVCEEILDGSLDDHFPLYVFQTGSGTHTNANVNEVIANRANQLLGYEPGSRGPLHPNDDVNMSQSSNDTFPTAMHVAAYDTTVRQALPAMQELQEALSAKAVEWTDVMKVGRTHLMDATPLTVGQEWSGYAAALAESVADVEHASSGLLAVALGGTAVGTGLNAPVDFRTRAIEDLAASTGYPFVQARNPFAAQGTLDPMVRAHASLKSTAVTLFKIANDLRWLASGPRHGLQELRIPANEPGSTIMPGKVNPTQAEAMLMVCLQVIGQDTTVAMAGAEGNFELNAFRPIVISNYLRSASLLADSCRNLSRFLVHGAELNQRQLRINLDRSVMVVTALSPLIGYERAAAIAHHAMENDLDVRDAALRLGVDPDTYDSVIRPIR
ncbi:MAG: class II fumarate hydratase [Candidatus Nanopelagicales bacterium]